MRPLTLTRNYLPHAEGSCLVEVGMTRIVTSASVTTGVPNWLSGKSTGWITAEYGMLPRSTHTRIRRPSSMLRQNGRAMEIQRLIGRVLRIVTKLDVLGERTIYIDCDVINADGGTRVASIIGAAVSLHDAGTQLFKNGNTPEHIMSGLIAAISVGIIEGNITVDMSYEQDARADVDMNVVMTDSGDLVEIQGTAEKQTFDRTTLDAMLDAAASEIKKIIVFQKEVLGIS